ncbi:MAG: hypothetical protein WAK31_15695 [Chthoniobacterales bacterium]
MTDDKCRVRELDAVLQPLEPQRLLNVKFVICHLSSRPKVAAIGIDNVVDFDGSNFRPSYGVL